MNSVDGQAVTPVREIACGHQAGCENGMTRFCGRNGTCMKRKPKIVHQGFQAIHCRQWRSAEFRVVELRTARILEANSQEIRHEAVWPTTINPKRVTDETHFVLFRDPVPDEGIRNKTLAGKLRVRKLSKNCCSTDTPTLRSGAQAQLLMEQ
jgi:hypothetical protein